MSATPRQRTGGFPQTPGTTANPRNRRTTPDTSSPRPQSSRSPPLPLAPENGPRSSSGSQPVIPLTILDGPQQRVYAFTVYCALAAWKLYDWVQLVEDSETSWWLFLKWIFIDCAFLFGLPELRIPWLELGQPAVMTIFIVHAFFDYMMMFNIPLPWAAPLLGLLKVFYDREISVSEHSVKVSNILHNHSLIMGKQIINILPEGSAVLNYHEKPFCIGLGKDRDTVRIPIQFNSSIPAEIELIRIDLDTAQEETIKLSKSEVKKIVRAIKDQPVDPSAIVHTTEYAVKKTGVYRLGRVLDEYKLEVQRKTKDTYVVPCPQAKIRAVQSSNRCIRDLSNLWVDVVGTPPLKFGYSRWIDGKDHSFHFQSLQPDDYSSPLLGSPSSSLVLATDDDTSWVKPRLITVPLNETMGTSGTWQYAIGEVRDGFGNVVEYTKPGDDLEHLQLPKHLFQEFSVKERPRAYLKGCDPRNPLKVAKGKSETLPVFFNLPGKATDDLSIKLTWDFSPIDSLTNSGEHGDNIITKSFTAKKANDKPLVSEPGLYTLRSVFSGACEGDVKEPSSCLLFNPIEPQLSIRAEEIPDKCAGNPVGLRVDMDLIGTPPFLVTIDVESMNGPRRETVRVDGLRHQINLLPKAAGGYHKYVFSSIVDAVYKNERSLGGADMTLEQNVKPAAFAEIRPGSKPKSGPVRACLEEQVTVDVNLLGDAPFTLEWELVHDGKRKAEKVTGIEASPYTIKTGPLSKGGDYLLALNSVQDKAGCRIFLNDELAISVKRQMPRAAFGLVENTRKIMAIEKDAVHIPLRLQGTPPWTVSYRKADGEIRRKTAKNDNDFLKVESRGVYEIVEVTDSQCPGSVDPQASRFEVDWYPRPELTLLQSEAISKSGNVFVKQEVCEGDIDGFEVNFKGSSPYHVEYNVRHQPFQGSDAISRKKFDAVLNRATIGMDTAKAGDYKYEFSTLGDNLYDSDPKRHSLSLKQRVNARPSATFVKPGQSFKLCKDEQDNEDKIPITLTGVAPFYVEIEIKHLSGNSPETYRIPTIATKSYGIQIPREHLRIGSQQVRIREVRDAKGCQQRYDVGPSVQVHLYDAPSIYPLDSRKDYCVGERISYTLSGTPPFEVWYDFDGQRKAKSGTTNFRRIAESPGAFTITSVSDKASECRAAVNITKTIHPLPSVKISKGKQTRVDIHQGNDVPIVFEFWGTPPFEFTYTRSTNAKKGQKSVVLETRHDTSYETSKVVRASQEGTYEVVAIKDKYCSFSTQQAEAKSDQKLLKF